MFKQWALEARDYKEGEPMCFCPINEKGDIVTGMNVISLKPPGELVAVFHQMGLLACDEWCENNRDLISSLSEDKDNG